MNNQLCGIYGTVGFEDEHLLNEMAEKVLDDSIIVREGYFKSDFVSDIMRKHKRSELLYNHQLYALLVFEVWHEIILNKM